MILLAAVLATRTDIFHRGHAFVGDNFRLEFASKFLSLPGLLYMNVLYNFSASSPAKLRNIARQVSLDLPSEPDAGKNISNF